jgi:hypothetical protein
MNKALLLGMVLLLSTPLAQAQTAPFAQLNAQAMTAYTAKSYAESGKLFDQAFKDKKAKPTATDYYNAACTWALAGTPDKAFRYLDQATAAGWDDVDHLQTDADLASLHTDKRWQPMLTKLTAAVAYAQRNYNQPLKKELEQIYATDQGIRRKISQVEKQYGMKAAMADSLTSQMTAIDERNEARVTAMIDQYGWPGNSLVGRQGSTTAFLVIQHARPSVQRKYLPLMREAAAKGELAKSSLALLEDRVLMYQGKPQLYGSQLRGNAATGKYELYPIEDEAHVDERRSTMGLGPLAEYVKRFGLDYVPKKN